MLYLDNGIKLAIEKVTLLKNGIQEIKEIGSEGREFYENLASKWDNISIVGYEDIIYTEEQLARYEEVKNFKYLTGDVNNYVMNGTYEVAETLEGEPTVALNAELKQLKAKKDNEDMQDLLAGLIGGAM